MPLDRRITLRIRGDATYDDCDRPVQGEFVDHGIWASRHDFGTRYWLGFEGSRTTQDTAYRIRFRSDLASRRIDGDRLNIIDDGVHYRVIEVAEVSDENFQRSSNRRRFQDLRAVRLDPQPTS